MFSPSSDLTSAENLLPVLFHQLKQIYSSNLLLFDQNHPYFVGRQRIFTFLPADIFTCDCSEPTVVIKTVNLHIPPLFLFFATVQTVSAEFAQRKDNTQPLSSIIYSHINTKKKMTNANYGPFPSWARGCSLVLKKVNPFRFCILICQLCLIVEQTSVKVIVHKHAQEH